jgi:hypothetical protein
MENQHLVRWAQFVNMFALVSKPPCERGIVGHLSAWSSLPFHPLLGIRRLPSGWLPQFASQRVWSRNVATNSSDLKAPGSTTQSDTPIS